MSELLVCVVVLVLFAIVWYQRARILVLVTGDDRIHVTPLDCVWWTCFRCCGQCRHEWTRWLTSCSCCPDRIRGKNAVKVMGAMAGVATHSVEISNIVIGDLPFQGRGSFYLSFECSQNPPMRTSMADFRSPKIVHFPEVITLRLRFSPLEPMVKIAVYELNIIGSEMLCYVYLSAENIIAWSMDSKQSIKRFAMKPASETTEVETLPWIVLEFDSPRNDVRNLDALGGTLSTVRTATWSRDPTGGTQGAYTDIGMKPFKAKYKLLDNFGNRVIETDEDDIGAVECYRDCVYCISDMISLLLMTLVFGYLLIRTYTWACWRKYRFLTMALDLQPNTTKAFTPAMLIHISDSCQEYVSGYDINEGEHPCRPSNKRIHAVCRRLPAHQRTPTAFTGFIQRYAGRDVPGVPCLKSACQYHDIVRQYDKTLLVVCAVITLWTCVLFRPCINQMIRKRKRKIMARRNESRFSADSNLL